MEFGALCSNCVERGLYKTNAVLMEDKNRDEKDEENIQCCVWIRQKTSKIICNDSLP